jgi:hypothetical protein
MARSLLLAALFAASFVSFLISMSCAANIRARYLRDSEPAGISVTGGLFGWLYSLGGIYVAFNLEILHEAGTSVSHYISTM